MLTKSGGLAGTLALAFAIAAAAPVLAADAPAAAPASPAANLQAPAPTVIVVDMDRIIGESKAGKSMVQQLQERVAAFQKSFQQQEADLGTEQQSLQRQQSILAQDAFSAKARDFQRRIDELHEKEAQANAALGQGQRDTSFRIQQALKPILEDIMKERSANVVLNRAAVVLLGEDRFEVTDEALKRLDEKLPTIAVNVSDAPAAASAPAAAAAPAKAAPATAPAKKK